MEYDAYHKLSLAKIDTADPVPQITDTDGFITTTINQIAQKLGGSFDVVLSALPEVDKEYLKKNYEGYKIMGANKITKKGIVKYDVGIVGKNSYGHKRHHNIYFDAKGNVVKQ